MLSSSSMSSQLSLSPFTLVEICRLFVPRPTELATINSAIQVVNYANNLMKLRETVQETAQRHLEGKSKRRTKKPTEDLSRLQCPACLEQCPGAHEDEEQCVLLHLVSCANAHIHHGVMYKSSSSSTSVE